MDIFNTLFSELSAWHWCILGIVLLVIEASSAVGFFLGPGLASLLLWIVLLIQPDLHWHYQLTIFAVLSIAISFAYWKFFRRFNKYTTAPTLNHKLAQFIGRVVTLSEPIRNGQGYVRIGDTRWAARSQQSSFEMNDTVKIIGVEDDHLLIEAEDTQ